jgi:hypothetical protein
MRQLTAVGLALGLVSMVACGSSGGSSGSGDNNGMGSGGSISLGAGTTGNGGTNANGGGTDSSGGGTTSTGMGGTSNTNGGPTPGHGEPVTMVTPVDMSKACASHALGASEGSLDIFIMLDKSLSMADKTPSGSSKWDVITKAIDDFVADPKSAGMEVGLGFFGIGSGGRNGGMSSSCTAADYANPAVPIAALPKNSMPIATAISMEAPSTNTPTEPALHGAINYAAQWAQQNPTHKVIVVFATDGLPNGCNSTVAGAAAIAAAGVKGPPPIYTYVIGVFGDKDCPGGVTQGQTCDVISNTNKIANGGGTQAAFIINASGDAGAEFLQALNAIRTANSVGCDFAVPAPSGGRVIDFSSATVEVTPGGGKATSLTWAASATACDPKAGGWYYDSASAPNHMLLCDASCKAVQADPAAKVDVMLGCLPPGTNGGGGAPGSGGMGSGGMTGTGGTPNMCLLSGQSCMTDGDCCSGRCTGGVCQTVVK